MGYTMIYASTADGLIGDRNRLPWHLPEEFQHFKNTTKHNVIVMGFNTWISINRKPLPGRRNLVCSESEPTNALDKIFTYNLNDLERIRNDNPHLTFFLIGGANTFKKFESLGLIDYVIHSTIHDGNQYDGDCYYQFDKDKYTLVKEEPHATFTVRHWKRKT